MPKTGVVFFRDTDGSVPYKEWMDDEVSRRDRRAAAKCAAMLELLRDKGSELRRPYADYLRDGIFELRTKFGGVNYRLLYFFHASQIIVVAHGLTKLDKVHAKDMELAIERKTAFEADPEKHCYEE